MKPLVLLLLFLCSAPVHSLGSRPTVADDFHGIDFKNRSYPYRFSWGKRINVHLKNGKYEYDFPDERGWFDVSHIYVTDVTNDGRRDAIVMLWHVACGVSCDGGSALFYIYSFDNHRLKPLWQYETGDLAYGCGLKSFAANRGTLTLAIIRTLFSTKPNHFLNRESSNQRSYSANIQVKRYAFRLAQTTTLFRS